MARKPENTFVGSVHDHLSRTLPYREKTHNPFRAGIWDWWYSGTRADLWVEYKFVVLPKRDSTLILPDLSELQKTWGRERYLEGRNLAVIVGSREGGVVLRDLEWEHGLTTAEFRTRLQDRKSLARWLAESVMKEPAPCLHPSPPPSKRRSRSTASPTP